MSMRAQPNAQYNLAAPASLPVRVAARARRRMFEIFLERTSPAPDDEILDVGVTADREYEASNYLEAWYPHKHRVTAVGIDDASFLETLYPGMRFQRADGRDLPFEDGSFDIVHSSAVIEHVGSAADQQRLLSELFRVARKAVFVTTPNRWFPIEFHTVLPLVHWLPPAAFRSVLRAVGQDFLAREENLNLLGASDLRRLAGRVSGCPFELESIALAGWPSNLLLTLRKTPGHPR